LEKSGKIKEAAMVMQRMLASQPGNLDMRLQLVNLYSQMGWTSKASEVIWQGLQAAKTDTEVHALKKRLQLLQQGGGGAPSDSPNIQGDSGPALKKNSDIGG
jgi:thioredoxin-like negative regulator of GroEL